MAPFPRTWLFTPGSRPDRFAKAVATSADVIILDLEDAVAEDEKTLARDHILAFLTRDRGSTPRIAVRINPLRRSIGLTDLLALTALKTGPDFILVPKTEEAVELSIVADIIDECGSAARIAGLVESARGVANIDAIARSTPRLAAIMFGAADYAADLGVQVQMLRSGYARGRIANACAADGIIAIDAPHFSLDDADGLAHSCQDARAMGFAGKALIHPKHLTVIETIFGPTDDERHLATRILETASQGVAMIDGKMVDKAMIRWANRI